MKAVSTLLMLTTAALADAQSQCLTIAAKIPSCGASCLLSAASAVGCAQTDFACQCSSSQSSAIQSKALDCIVNGCGAVTGRQVSSSTQAVCSCVANGGSHTTTTAQILPRDTTYYNNLNSPTLYGSFTTSTTSTNIAGGYGAGGQDGGCVLCPPGVGIPTLELPPPGDGGPNNTPEYPTTTFTTSGASSSSSSGPYQTGSLIADYIATDDGAVAQNVAAEILSEQSPQACMIITTNLELVGTPCGSTTSSEPTLTEPPPQNTGPPPQNTGPPPQNTGPPPQNTGPPPTADVPSINGVPLEYFGSKNGQCSTGTQADFDAQAAKQCLASLRGPNWIDVPCASMQGGCSGQIDACNGVTVESSGSFWNNPQDCYDGCVSCLAIAMDQGWNNAKCDIQVNSAKCEIYYILQPSSKPTSPTPPLPAPTGLENSGTMTGTCTNGTQADFNAQAAKNCLGSLRSHNWIDMPCAAMQGNCPGQIDACNGVSVKSSGTFWNDARDCYDGCVSCLAVAMDEGFNNAKCHIRSGAANCDISYNVRPGS